MSLASIRARYDGEQVRLLEPAPVHEAYEVLVVFLEPARTHEKGKDLSRFWRSFGAWKDDRPAEATIRDIREARTSKEEAPSL